MDHLIQCASAIVSYLSHVLICLMHHVLRGMGFSHPEAPDAPVSVHTSSAPAAICTQQAGAAKDLPSLPECIQAHVLELSGVKGASSLGVACVRLQRDMWESTEIWQALTNPFKVSHPSISRRPAPCAAALRARYRWYSYGLEDLCSWRARPPRMEEGVVIMESAKNAIRGLMPEDALQQVDAVADALHDLLGWYDSNNDAAYRCAEEVVEAAASQAEIFGTAHLQRLKDTLEDSRVLRTLLVDVLEESVDELEEMLEESLSPARHGRDLDLVVDDWAFDADSTQCAPASLCDDGDLDLSWSSLLHAPAESKDTTDFDENVHLVSHRKDDEVAMDRIIGLLTDLAYD